MVDNLRFLGRHRSGVAEATETRMRAAVVNKSETFIAVMGVDRARCFEEFAEEEIL